MKVLITGAAGNLGQKLRRYLGTGGGYELTLLDRRIGEDRCLMTADLAKYDESWVRHFRGQDVIVHLAANARPWDPWGSLQRDNLDALLNVFRAAIENRVKRVVFASTGRAFLGYMDHRLLVRHDFTPKPVDFYAATKLFGERLGYSYVDQYGLSVICLRIGTVWPGDNCPEGKPYIAQRRWLSNRDFCQAAEKAINVPDVRFAALFVTSDNEGKPWDLTETRRVLGYAPLDCFIPARPLLPVRLAHRLRTWPRRLLERMRRPAVLHAEAQDGTHRANQRSTL